MEIKDGKKQEKLEWIFSVRCNDSQRKFIKKHKLSPSIVFRQAIEELVEKEGDNGK